MNKQKIPLINILGGADGETDNNNNNPEYTRKIILKPETDIYKTDTYDSLRDKTQDKLDTFRDTTEKFLNDHSEKIESANSVDESKKNELTDVFNELTKHTIGPDGKKLLKADGIFQKRIGNIQKKNKSSLEAERLKIKEGIETEKNKYLDKTNSIIANVKQTIVDNKDDIDDLKQMYENAAQRLKKRTKDLNNVLKSIKHDQRSVKKSSKKIHKSLDKKLKTNLKSSEKRLKALKKNSKKDNLDIVISKTVTDINNEINKLKAFNTKRDELDKAMSDIDDDFLTRGLKGLTLEELNKIMATLKNIHDNFKPGSSFKMPKGDTLNNLKLIVKSFNSLSKRQKKLEAKEAKDQAKKQKLTQEQAALSGGSDFITFEDNLIYEPHYLDYIKYKIKYLELKYLGHSDPF